MWPYAWQNQQAGAAQTYVGMVGEVIAGYYALAAAQLALEDAPERLNKGLAKYPVCPSCCSRGWPLITAGKAEVLARRCCETRCNAHCKQRT